MKVDGFKTATRAADSDSAGITETDLSNLRTAFSTLTTQDKEKALEFLLVENFSGTYAYVKDLAGSGVGGDFDNFRAGVRAAKNDSNSITDRDRSNIRDAFSRLTTQDQEKALEFLAGENFPNTYGSVKDLAGSSVGFTFDAFRSGMRALKNDSDDMSDVDLRTARDSFSRLTTQDQSAALGFLLTDNRPDAYAYVKDLAGSGVSLDFDTFRAGMKATGGDSDGMNDRDLRNARDAFSRLTTQDQGRALEFLLTDNRPVTYAEVKDLAGSGVSLSFQAFRAGMKATGGDSDGMTDRDLRNARDAISRMTTQDKAKAAEFLMTDNRPRTFAALKDLL